MTNKITIISPCYNVEKTLPRYLDSILSQSYRNIELIAVDDGSTDDTARILNEYIPIFSENGMELKYIYQDNLGLGGAINTGLKHITGQFLCWSDPDDFYYPDAMSKRLRILLDNPEYGIVTCEANVVGSDSPEVPIGKETDNPLTRDDPYQFEYMLNGNSLFCAGCHMIRMSSFDDANPNRVIYPSRKGQNLQVLLPVYYKYKRIFLKEPLYAYVIYKNSMSHTEKTEKDMLEQWNEHEKLLESTINQIGMNAESKSKYLSTIKINYIRHRFYTAIDFRDKKLLHEQYDLLKQYGENTPEIDRLYRRNRSVFGKMYYKTKELFQKGKAGNGQ